ncbi:MAG: CvpA family protein [Pirellulales bacterium]|nr:CvpA family protein [Planctomycetales bacterium]
MHPYDIFMLIVLIGTTVFGAWKGMAWQLASLASVAVSCFVALRFHSELAPRISAEAPWNRFLAMLILYIGTSIAVWLLFRIVARLIDRVKLKEFDRQLGAMFGAAKGVLLCITITFFVVTLSSAGRNAVLESKSGVYIARLIDKANPVLPDEVHQTLGPYLDELNRKLDPNESNDTDGPSPLEDVERMLDERLSV